VDIHPFNAFKLLRHGDRVEAMQRGERVAPVTAEIDLSNSCPHDCPFCSFGTSESQGYRQKNWVQMDTPRGLTLLEELATAGVKSVTFTGGGEPLVHRHVSQFFEKTSALGLKWGVVTNGFMLKGSAREWIAKDATFVRVSLDAGTSETHQYSHGTKTPQFEQILDNMLATRELAGERPLAIGAGFCVMEQNWREIVQATGLVKSHGGSYIEIRPTFPTDWRGDGWGSALSNDSVDAAKVEIDYARHKYQDDTFRVVGMVERFDKLQDATKGYDKCQIGPLMTVIGADLRGWHCCVQRGMDGFSYGSFKDQTFNAVWLSDKHKALIENIDVSRCPRCRYDRFNLLARDAFEKDGMHRDFL
jgi:GTP 3',8-cyclase